MKKIFEPIFVFTKKEQRGLLVLLLLTCFILVAQWVWHLGQVEPDYPLEQDSTLLHFLASLEEGSSSPKIPYYSGPAMDLNKASRQELLELGFSDKLCETFLRFRESGAAFYSASDVRKVYGINDELWERIAPYVHFPEPQEKGVEEIRSMGQVASEPQRKKNHDNSSIPQVNLNHADTFQLMTIPGIGKVFAGRILGYRELLGGYVTKEQLLEVYGMTVERFHQCTSFVYIDADSLRKLSLNRADFSTLLRHPYLATKQVQTLLAFRAYTDSTITYQGLLENRVLDTAHLRKILPYLSFDK